MATADATTTSQEVCKISIRNDINVSQVTNDIPCDNTLSHRSNHTHNTILYLCNGGVARTHVCNQINCYIYISFEYQDSL